MVHRIRIFGNMLPDGRAELKFDVNVVPDADYTRDYEELYQDFNTKNGIEVNTDMLAVARGLCGHKPGIACIMGTGSNS